MVDFTCKKCGSCCHEYPFASEINFKRIPVFPSELEPLEAHADKHDIDVKFLEDVIVPDMVNQKIIVITYRIILDGENGSCPFYDRKIGCTVDAFKPLACKAYPLAQKRVDAFTRSIEIDPYCCFIEENELKVKNMDENILKEYFKKEFHNSKRLMERNKKIMLKLRMLASRGKIAYPSEVKGEKYDKWLKQWERVYIDML